METLTILWTSDNKDTFFNMVSMYAVNSLKRGWWEEVTVIIWGASARLSGTDAQIQLELMEMIQQGVKVKACKACADAFEVAPFLEKTGIEVDYMGEPLTAILKSGTKLITV
ncbi:MAG TPA: DsrE family protein [Bacteroidales bacterium]|nr:DsrE family protein [Bacteroidales bacterium]